MGEQALGGADRPGHIQLPHGKQPSNVLSNLSRTSSTLMIEVDIGHLLSCPRDDATVRNAFGEPTPAPNLLGVSIFSAVHWLAKVQLGFWCWTFRSEVMRSTAIHEAELPASVGRRQASQLEAWLHGAGTSGTNMQRLIEVRWLQRACPDTNDAVRNKGCICAQQLAGTGFSSFSVNISKQPRAARPRVWLLSRHVQTSPEPPYWPRRGLAGSADKLPGQEWGFWKCAVIQGKGVEQISWPEKACRTPQRRAAIREVFVKLKLIC